MKERLTRVTHWIIVLIVGLLAAGCQSSRAERLSMLLPTDNPTMVSFPLMAASQIYDFSADAQLPMQISIVPITRDLSYAAELRDDRGSLLATLTSTAIQNAVLTISPGTERYHMAFKSDNTTLQGVLSVQLSRIAIQSNQVAFKAASPVAVVLPYQSGTPSIATSTNNSAYMPCMVSSSTGVNVNLRSGPGTEHSVVGALTYGTSLTVTGVSQNGWYQVTANGQSAWVSGTVSTLSGNCDNLPNLMSVPFQSPDNPVIQLVIADTGWGSVVDKITSTDLSASDRVMVTAPTWIASHRYEEFALTLLCSGNGVDNVRWGAVEKPTLKCGGTVVLPLTVAYRQQTVAVTLLQSSLVSDVQYTLMASRRT